MTAKPAIAEFILGLADDKHLIGQQHAEWIGVTPFLEEDLAFCSIGQDELGHAAMLYEWLVGDDDLEIDRLAYGRTAAEYRSCWFVEMPTNDWELALVRHWLFDEADMLRWELLSDSSDEAIVAIAARVEREEVFHRRHASGIVDALMADNDAAERLRSAAQQLAPLALGIFEPVGGEAEAIADGIVAGPLHDQLETWKHSVEGRFGQIDWSDSPKQRARTERSEFFDALMSRMREVLDLDPKAVW